MDLEQDEVALADGALVPFENFDYRAVDLALADHFAECRAKRHGGQQPTAQPNPQRGPGIVRTVRLGEVQDRRQPANRPIYPHHLPTPAPSKRL